ncbi:putative membrane protein [Microterricola gilva]|uniref:Putative membrane protein n=1 Tax=Microterricola gilva TaxID=393267 RepID=A0A4Q8AKV0_9MICO|nr:TMEM175 family protein [Microterricola gilva]RZU65160.1 putative membrane protein [Microterricola gilva]
MTDQPRLLSPRRLEAFSDGVFAIAATLLVLDLSVDHLGSISNNDQLWHALGAISESVLSFVISFLLLCMLWMVHTRQFEYVKRVDDPVLWLNSLRLLGVVLIPFTTSVNADFSELLLGRLVLPLNFLWVLLFDWALWRYVTTSPRGLLGDMSDDEVRASSRRALGAVVTGLVVVLLAPFIGSWAFLAFAVVPPLDAAIRGRRRRRR